jgi:hypothetical protein
MVLWRALLLLIPLTLVASPAWSKKGGEDDDDQGENEHGGKRPKLGHGAPEIDTAALGGAAVLLAGGAVLLGTRIAKRRKAERT